jgi:hypothetical protein
MGGKRDGRRRGDRGGRGEKTGGFSLLNKLFNYIIIIYFIIYYKKNMSSTVSKDLRRLMDIIDENKEALPEGAYLEAGKLIMAQARVPPVNIQTEEPINRNIGSITPDIIRRMLIPLQPRPPLPPRQPRQPRPPRPHSNINNHRKIMKNMFTSINKLFT